MVFEWEETFLSIWLFPWSLGRSIIALRLQTEMAQTHRHPANQNGSCGSGTHRPLISLGLGLVWCEQTKGITPAHLCSCQVVCQNGKRFFKEKLDREKLWAAFCPPAPRFDRDPAHNHSALVGLVNWEDASCVDFSFLQHVIWPGALLSPAPFLLAPSAETSRVIPSWSALLLPLFLALPQKSILSFMSLPFMHKGTVVVCCGTVPLHFHQWGFLSFISNNYNGLWGPKWPMQSAQFFRVCSFCFAKVNKNAKLKANPLMPSWNRVAGLTFQSPLFINF